MGKLAPDRLYPPTTLDGLLAENRYVYNVGEDGYLYRRKLGYITLGGAWTFCDSASERELFNALIEDAAQHVLDNMLPIGEDSSMELHALLNGD